MHNARQAAAVKAAMDPSGRMAMANTAATMVAVVAAVVAAG